MRHVGIEDRTGQDRYKNQGNEISELKFFAFRLLSREFVETPYARGGNHSGRLDVPLHLRFTLLL